VALNDKLGATERVKGGLFTALLDHQPDATAFEVDPGLTSVSILDFELSQYLKCVSRFQSLFLSLALVIL
jgi:hypothetical protein